MGDIDTYFLISTVKSDGELNLAVWWSGLKLPNKKSANILSHTMCNDAMHATSSALGPARRPSTQAVHVASSALA